MLFINTLGMVLSDVQGQLYLTSQVKLHYIKPGTKYQLEMRLSNNTLPINFCTVTNCKVPVLSLSEPNIQNVKFRRCYQHEIYNKQQSKHVYRL